MSETTETESRAASRETGGGHGRMTKGGGVTDRRPVEVVRGGWGQQTRARSQVSAGVDERPGDDKSTSPSRVVPAVIAVASRSALGFASTPTPLTAAETGTGG